MFERMFFPLFSVCSLRYVFVITYGIYVFVSYFVVTRVLRGLDLIWSSAPQSATELDIRGGVVFCEVVFSRPGYVHRGGGCFVVNSPQTRKHIRKQFTNCNGCSTRFTRGGEGSRDHRRGLDLDRCVFNRFSFYCSSRCVGSRTTPQRERRACGQAHRAARRQQLPAPIPGTRGAMLTEQFSDGGLQQSH